MTILFEKLWGFDELEQCFFINFVDCVTNEKSAVSMIEKGSKCLICQPCFAMGRSHCFSKGKFLNGNLNNFIRCGFSTSL